MELFQSFEQIIHLKAESPTLAEPIPLAMPVQTQFVAERRILLAEDNAVNQQLAQLMLEKSGFMVQTVSNGKEALEAFKTSRFDLIVMDCQMPEMDGYQATVEIREHELCTGGHIPILALTANVLKEDRDHCLASGMDAYLAKPIKKRPFIEAVNHCISNRSHQAINQATFSQLKELENENDPNFVAKIVHIYLETSPSILDKLRTAVQESNPQEIQHQSHSLKSSSASLGAENLSATCREMEMMGHSGEISGAKAKMVDLERLYRAVEIELSDYLKSKEKRSA